MKYNRLPINIFFICIISIFLINPALAATYYVKNGGMDNADGLSDENAWGTIYKVNSVNFVNRDIIKFKRGNTFKDRILTLNAITSPSSKTITIDAYGNGSLPWIGGNSKQALHIDSDGLSIILKNIRIDGQENYSNYAQIYLHNLNNITIDGVTGDGSVDWKSDYQRAIHVTKVTGNIEIKNCNLQNWGGGSELWGIPAKPTGTGSDSGIISVVYQKLGSLSIHDNTFSNTESDCIILEDIDVVTTIYNNILWNGGENSLDIKGCAGPTTVYGNIMGRDSTFKGTGGSSTGAKRSPVLQILSNNHLGGSRDVTIRDNSIGPTDMSNIRITRIDGTNTNENISIHNNYFSFAKWHLLILKYSENVNVYDNIFNGLKKNGRFIFEYTPGTKKWPEYKDNEFYIDTDAGTLDWYPEFPGLISLNDSDSILVGNSFQVNDPNDVILYVRSDSKPTLQSNCYSNSNSSPAGLINWKGTTFYNNQENDWLSFRNTGATFSIVCLSEPPQPADNININVNEPLQAPMNLKIVNQHN